VYGRLGSNALSYYRLFRQEIHRGLSPASSAFYRNSAERFQVHPTNKDRLGYHMAEITLAIAIALFTLGYCLALFIKNRDEFVRFDWILLGCLLGLFFFLSVFGHQPLYITNVGWTLAGDRSPHVIGLYFFRNEPWGFPIGAIRNYGYPYGTGLLGIEGYPFLLLVKLLNRFFPQAPLQLHGIWMLICYMLQGVGGMLLMRRISSHIFIKTLGTILFIISPIMLFRALAHTSLMTHFLLLFAINLLFAVTITTRTMIVWASILFLSLWIQMYIFVLVWLLLCTFLYKLVVISKSCSLRRATFLSVASIIPSILLFFILQPITPSVNLHKGFGIYAMNLNAPINPSGLGNWSRLLPVHPLGSGQYEGFNYLGAGIIILVCLLAIPAIKTISRKAWLYNNHWLILACLSFTFYAVSNVVMLGDTVLIQYPNFFGNLAEIFRSSGRFFWPVWYLILFGSMKWLVQRETRRTAFAVLVCVTMIQIYDFSSKFQEFHKMFHTLSEWKTPLKSDKWNFLIQNYARISFETLGPVEEVIEPIVVPFGLMAAAHKKQINIGFFSRYPAEMLTAARQEHRDLRIGKYRMDTIYIITEDVAEVLSHRKKADDLLAQIDNYILFAPGLYAKDSSAEYFRAVDEKKFGIPLNKKTEMRFTLGFPRSYLRSGWSGTEPWGTWSEGEDGLLSFAFQEQPRHDIRIKLQFNIFMTNTHNQQHVSVYANDTSVAEWSFSAHADSMPITRVLSIPSTSFRSPELQLRFHIDKPTSPASLGISDDKRRLGIGMIKMEIIPAGEG
jgi:hypothetical protein